MKPTIDISPEAKADLIELRDCIAKDKPKAAQQFYFAAEEAMEVLAAMPEMGGKCEFRSGKAGDLRVWPIRKFENHLIFYRPIENGIEVVRVLHGARDLDSLFV